MRDSHSAGTRRSALQTAGAIGYGADSPGSLGPECHCEAMYDALVFRSPVDVSI